MTKAIAKAQELVDKFLSIQDSESKDGGGLMFISEAKQCAIIAVDEMLQYSDFHCEFLQDVKQEIEKI